MSSDVDPDLVLQPFLDHAIDQLADLIEAGDAAIKERLEPFRWLSQETIGHGHHLSERDLSTQCLGLPQVFTGLDLTRRMLPPGLSAKLTRVARSWGFDLFIFMTAGEAN
jgi:hypothetical protein